MPDGGLGQATPTQDIAEQDTIVVLPYRTIGPFSAHVTLREVHTDELEITEQPVEMGASVTDHSYKRPAELEVECAWSNSPQQTYSSDGNGVELTGSQDLTGNGIDSVKDVYQKLLKLQADREPIDVYTGKRVYYNMLIKRLVTRSDPQTEEVLVVNFSLKQVILVSTQTLVLGAPAEDQADPESTQETTDRGTQQLDEEPAEFNADAAETDIESTLDAEELEEFEGIDPTDAFEIPTIAAPQSFDIDIGLPTGPANVDLQWCKDAASWCMDIKDKAGNLLVAGLPMVTGTDLLSQFKHLDIPGALIAQTSFDPGKVPGFKELGDVGRLFFVKT